MASYLQRPIATRDELPRFLIVCEGKCTEPFYFEALATELRVSVNVRIEGRGDNTDHLVETAISLSNEDDYVETWCVFDRDSFPAGHFNRAIQLAKSNKLQVAYSNEAFELWYVLHFEFLNTGLSRHDYKRKLSAHLNRRYQKGDRTIYHELHRYQPVALSNAENLLACYDPLNAEQANPSTTVHLLVAALNRFRRL
jgi:hypothetical protein